MVSRRAQHRSRKWLLNPKLRSRRPCTGTRLAVPVAMLGLVDRVSNLVLQI